MDNAVELLAKQIVSQLPVLVIYAAAMIAAVIYWRRCPIPSLLTLLSAGGQLALTIGYMLLYTYLIHTRNDMGAGNLGTILTVTGFVVNLLRAGALLLLVVAVFYGRSALQPPTSSPRADDELENPGGVG